MTASELHDRILDMASQGLKPRDIASALGLHPVIVVRLLENRHRPAPPDTRATLFHRPKFGHWNPAPPDTRATHKTISVLISFFPCAPRYAGNPLFKR